MIKFICYPKCTTCQRAKKWLDDNKIEYELRDIKLDNPSHEELTEWYKKSGLPLKKFFNTSGLLYKSLDLKNQLPKMTEDEMAEIIAQAVGTGTVEGVDKTETVYVFTDANGEVEFRGFYGDYEIEVDGNTAEISNHRDGKVQNVTV